ncbi:hypothetical protein FTO70_08770 [Methanosarcina sp. KYL-1]|uniref:hypothetical protein n=1 Tax=Methanosarcina sp. KYL-1 TaxID=2602068 RepID=UPI002100B33E|nr:hypothetical protein [Methanosarcina sp. KYL-1]MCQ1535767.1 hypothetical protein [Methanosarcina sp. KYL-1]
MKNEVAVMGSFQVIEMMLHLNGYSKRIFLELESKNHCYGQLEVYILPYFLCACSDVRISKTYTSFSSSSI